MGFFGGGWTAEMAWFCHDVWHFWLHSFHWPMQWWWPFSWSSLTRLKFQMHSGHSDCDRWSPFGQTITGRSQDDRDREFQWSGSMQWWWLFSWSTLTRLKFQMHSGHAMGKVLPERTTGRQSGDYSQKKIFAKRRLLTKRGASFKNIFDNTDWAALGRSGSEFSCLAKTFPLIWVQVKRFDILLAYFIPFNVIHWQIIVWLFLMSYNFKKVKVTIEVFNK